MHRQYAVLMKGFDHPMENEPNAHGGNEESDDAGGRVNARWAEPRKDSISVSEAQISHAHGRQHGAGNREE